MCTPSPGVIHIKCNFEYVDARIVCCVKWCVSHCAPDEASACAPLPGVMLLWSHAIKPSGAWQADEYSQVCHNHYLTMLIADNHHNHHHNSNHIIIIINISGILIIIIVLMIHICRISHDGYPLLCNKILRSNLSFWGNIFFQTFLAGPDSLRAYM